RDEGAVAALRPRSRRRGTFALPLAVEARHLILRVPASSDRTLRQERFELRLFVGGQRAIEGVEEIELRRCPRPGDGNERRLLREHPGEADLSGRATDLRSEGTELFDEHGVLFAGFAGEAREVGADVGGAGRFA